MNGLATYRHRNVAWGRRVLGAFVVAWLSIVLQPCSMAAGVEDHGCPHCPPSESPPCVGAVSPDCAFDDQLNAEPRGQQIKLKDTPSELPVTILPAPFGTAPIATLKQPIPNGSVLLHPGGPPRNVVFCVYLK